MSRHKCTKEIYKAFLQASSVRYSGLALSEVSPTELSHDSVSRWLNSRCFRPKEIYQESEKVINFDNDYYIIGDDTVLDKHRSKKIDLVNYQYSGNTHDVIPGIGLLNLVLFDKSTKESIPIDYRIYDKDTDGKTKNTHFRGMLSLAKKRGLIPKAVIVDAWYSSLDNLKAIRDHNWIWVAGLRKNRRVNRNEKLEDLDIPDEGLKIHLRGYDWITVFRFVAKNGRTDYIGTNMEDSTKEIIQQHMKARWSIEVYYRELKQTCGIERCQSRSGRAQRNHIFLSVMVWFEKHKKRCAEKITFYQQQWDIIKDAISLNMKNILATT